jgi:hypothetical protein
MESDCAGRSLDELDSLEATGIYKLPDKYL